MALNFLNYFWNVYRVASGKPIRCKIKRKLQAVAVISFVACGFSCGLIPSDWTSIN